MQVKKDYYYQILELSPGASLEDIKVAFRRLAREYHPDLHPDNAKSAEKFKSIAIAYQVLRDFFQSDRNSNKEVTEKTTSDNYQDFYVRGIQLSLERDYQRAQENFTKAIELQPDFERAYLKRCETLFKLGDDRGVLRDCEELLKLDNNCAEAYYYRGRSRYRLGYVASAVEAYAKAIKISNNYALAYYYCGLAYNELKESSKAIEALQTAAKLFQQQNDSSGYKLAIDTLKNLNISNKILSPITVVFERIFRSFTSFIFNPVGDILPFFAHLEEKEAIYLGIFYGIFADFCFVIGMYFNRVISSNFSFLNLAIVGLMPFVSLVILGSIACLILTGFNDFSQTVFVAGAAVLHLGFLGLINGFSLPGNITIVFAVFTCCYTILTLYSGCTQILNLSEATAAFTLPIMLLVSGWMSYSFFITMIF